MNNNTGLISGDKVELSGNDVKLTTTMIESQVFQWTDTVGGKVVGHRRRSDDLPHGEQWGRLWGWIGNRRCGL